MFVLLCIKPSNNHCFLVFQVQKTRQVFRKPTPDICDRVFSQRGVVSFAANRAFHTGQIAGTSYPGNHSSRRLL